MKFKRTCYMFVCEGGSTVDNKSFGKLLAVQRSIQESILWAGIWPYNSAPLPHGTWRALWNMRREVCLIFNMTLIDGSFPLLCRCCE